MTTKILEPPSDSQTLVRRAAFRLLLARAKPITPAELAEHSGIRIESVSKLVDLLDGAGRIRRNAAGEVVGSAGLSVVPDRHEIELDGRRFWARCAYDILGISARSAPTAERGHRARLTESQSCSISRAAVLTRMLRPFSGRTKNS